MLYLRKRKRLINKIFDVLLMKGFEGAYIVDISLDEYSVYVTIQLPIQREQEELSQILPNIQQELNALDYKIIKSNGKCVTIKFGKRDLSYIHYDNNLLHDNTLKIELPSAYGYSILDFEDGASCHLLNGGTTRMGKTSLLLYLATVLYLQTKGQIKLYITSTKLKDYYPFENVENVTLIKSESTLITILDECLEEYKERDKWLYTKELSKATDSKSVKKMYPHMYYLFKPIFLIIDEYARFSDNKNIQKKVMELVETAGYVNIHVIISTQRPDARSVLPPRIKGNLLARICFTTADRNNSLIILDQEGAEKLGKIQGRALYLDSDLNLIQVPYIEPEVSYKLLTPYRKVVIKNENDENRKRQRYHDVAKKVQNLYSQSDSLHDF